MGKVPLGSAARRESLLRFRGDPRCITELNIAKMERPVKKAPGKTGYRVERPLAALTEAQHT